MNAKQKQLAKNMTSSLKFKWFAFTRLPSLLYWRVRVQELGADRCKVAIPFRRSTQNPFKSIYFSAQAGAAELSTGALVLLHTTGVGSYSMLVTHMEMQFGKKATSTVTFTCKGGEAVGEAVAKMKQPGDTGQVELVAVGVDEAGDEVSRLRVFWSLKKRK